MNYRLCLVCALLLAGCQRAPQPNFLFILVDDLGYMDLGAYNAATFYETPNIDRLAREGVQFTEAYAAAPVCSPTRASIMTGLYPVRMGTTNWFGAPQPNSVGPNWKRNRMMLPAPYNAQLPHEEITIAEALQAGGYRTFFAGKWHLGTEGSYPEDHGFEINKGGWERGGPYGRGRYFTPYDNPRLEDGPEGEHLPARLARETAAFIAEHQDEPFLAFLSFYSVHTPLMTRPDLEAKYRAKPAPEDSWGTEGQRRVRQVQNHAVYAGMVEAMDQAVGTMLRALDELGLADNTVVFFTSDNGGLSTSEGHPTSNLPLRAGKGWLYEGGIREPLIIRWPKHLAGGRVEQTPVISNDYLPTILAMARLSEPEGSDGVSLLPLLLERNAPERDLFWHYPHYGNQGGSPGSAVRSGPWKLIRFYEDERLELYNLANDIGEQKDVAATVPERVQAMRASLDAWLAHNNARYPTYHDTAAEGSDDTDP